MPRSADPERLYVVLVSTRNPLNLGAAARAMSNFGRSRLRVVAPYDVAWRQARSAVGAESVLKSAEEFPTVAEAVADCTLVVGTTSGSRRQLRQSLRDLPAAAPLIRSRLCSGPVALLFGSEKRGLSNDDLSQCDWLLRIPTASPQPSMNLAQAVAVCLYELARAKPARREAREHAAPATAGDLQRLTELWLSVLTASGYLPALPAPARKEKVRRLLRAMDLDKRDAELWLGMLRQVHWKLRS